MGIVRMLLALIPILGIGLIVVLLTDFSKAKKGGNSHFWEEDDTNK